MPLIITKEFHNERVWRRVRASIPRYRKVGLSFRNWHNYRTLSTLQANFFLHDKKTNVIVQSLFIGTQREIRTLNNTSLSRMPLPNWATWAHY